MQYIDDAEFQIAIDLDNGARITSITWRDMQFAVPYRGDPLTHGWYAMGPWAGRIRDGIMSLQGEGLKKVLARAAAAAAITCSRAGAQPPYKHELAKL